MAAWNSAVVIFLHMLESTLTALHREETLCDFVRAKFLSVPGKQPFLGSWDAMAFAVTLHLGADVDLPGPLSQFIVHQDLRLE